MQPVYALTAGLTNNAVKKAVAQALEQVEGIREFLPEELICRYHLLDRRLQWKESISRRQKKNSMKQESALYLKNF